MSAIRIASELWAFMRAHKKLWLLPIIVILVVTAALFGAVQGSAHAPFIYAIF